MAKILWGCLFGNTKVLFLKVNLKKKPLISLFHRITDKRYIILSESLM